jgi:hypothetical protein
MASQEMGHRTRNLNDLKYITESIPVEVLRIGNYIVLRKVGALVAIVSHSQYRTLSVKFHSRFAGLVHKGTEFTVGLLQRTYDNPNLTVIDAACPVENLYNGQYKVTNLFGQVTATVTDRYNTERTVYFNEIYCHKLIMGLRFTIVDEVIIANSVL